MSEKLISVVVPLYEEEGNVERLVQSVHHALADMKFELILVDDGSTDQTFSEVTDCCEQFAEVIGIQLRRNFGQSAAMSAGFSAAQGDYIVYMDGDLQTDPEDILSLLQVLEDQQLDMVNGWRKDRKDGKLLRTWPSKIANRLIRKSTGVFLHDYGCPMKLMRKDVAKNLYLYGEMHRFIPALASLYGARIGEVAVRHQARTVGQSKYGISRTFRVLVDLLLVIFFLKFTDRPMQLFGLAGGGMFCSGLAINGWLTVDKLLFGADLAGRPLLQMGSLLIVSGILLFGIGLILEMLTRLFFEATKRQSYTIRNVIRGMTNAE